MLVIRGITAKQAAQISSLLSLIRLSHQPQDLHPVIRTPEDIWTLVKHLQFEDREHFLVLGLSTKNRVVLKETVSIGSLSSSIVPPREYHKPLVSHSWASTILVHNHPSGDPSPSEEDMSVTRRLSEGGQMLGDPGARSYRGGDEPVGEFPGGGDDVGRFWYGGVA